MKDAATNFRLSDAQRFAVYARSLKPPYARRLLERGLTEANADAYVNFAVARRGVDEECFFYEPDDSEPSSGAADQDAGEAPVQDQPKGDQRTTAQETRT